MAKTGLSGLGVIVIDSESCCRIGSAVYFPKKMDNVGGLMNKVKLSDRLQLLLDQVPEGSRLADIGSDHALLPVAAVESGKAVSAIAGEVNQGRIADRCHSGPRAGPLQAGGCKDAGVAAECGRGYFAPLAAE